MTSKQKQMIIGGILSTVVVGLIIFLVLFFGEIGPFSKYVAPDDFWKTVEEIMKEEKSYNEQWYVKSTRQPESDMWSVELYGSKDEEPATKDTVEKTIKESKLFAWSEMTKAQTDEECSTTLDAQEVDIETDSKGDELSIVLLLTHWVFSKPLFEVQPNDFWDTVAKIKRKETSYKHWYVAGKQMKPTYESGCWNFILCGSTEEILADKGSIEKTIEEATKFVWSDMKLSDYFDGITVELRSVRIDGNLDGIRERLVDNFLYDHSP